MAGTELYVTFGATRGTENAQVCELVGRGQRVCAVGRNGCAMPAFIAMPYPLLGLFILDGRSYRHGIGGEPTPQCDVVRRNGVSSQGRAG